MKVILSRKGFDSEYGGSPSPVLPDGTMVSFPIPSSDSRRFAEIATPEGRPINQLMRELGLGEKLVDGTCHLDPDLFGGAVARLPGWRPSLGQMGGPQTHLAQREVGKGDLFLFFGWFSQTEVKDGRLSYLRGREEQFHAVFGYLQVGEVIEVGATTRTPEWLRDHPHVNSGRPKKTGNTIYVASDSLSFLPGVPGGGMLRFSALSRLTKSGLPRSRWNLKPEIFKGARISYHSEKSWKEGFFQSAAKGQEFVIESTTAIDQWARELIESGIGHPSTGNKTRAAG